VEVDTKVQIHFLWLKISKKHFSLSLCAYICVCVCMCFVCVRARIRACVCVHQLVGSVVRCSLLEVISLLLGFVKGSKKIQTSSIIKSLMHTDLFQSSCNFHTYSVAYLTSCSERLALKDLTAAETCNMCKFYFSKTCHMTLHSTRHYKIDIKVLQRVSALFIFQLYFTDD
jgi:hypothetical protein